MRTRLPGRPLRSLTMLPRREAASLAKAALAKGRQEECGQPHSKARLVLGNRPEVEAYIKLVS